MTSFEPGSTIERREVLHGQPWLSCPVSVVADDGDVLAVTIPPGAPFTYHPHPFGEHPWFPQAAWGGTVALQLYRPDILYSVWRFFADGPADGWYVNFEAPLVRGRTCIETDDYGLDIVIAEDRSWTWKDVEDPPAMLAAGRMTSTQLDELDHAATALAESLDSGERRWWEAWSSWLPVRR